MLLLLSLPGCRGAASPPSDARTADADRQVRAAWGKALADLPAVELHAITPNNESIKEEFAEAFSLHHAVAYGQRVKVVWHSVGGGGSTIVTYLQNVYRAGDTSGIDVLWGGGDLAYPPLAKAGILEPLTLAPDVLDNVPATLGSVRLIDDRKRWVGTALSAFGYVYNAGMLRRCHIAAPAGTWDDLGDGRFADLIELADPTQSGSAGAAYRMIAASGRDWPNGWAKLLGLLANAKRFTDSAGTAASATTLGDALVATCIDFYGALRVQEAPDQIAYVSPRGQTAFTPDPIAILKNPPHPQLAARFVDFVMSAPAQALLALPAGAAGGPKRYALGRQPIRKDVYQTYGRQFSSWTVNPYEAGMAMPLEGFARKIDYRVLVQLVKAAAVDNTDALRSARAALRTAGRDPAATAAFVSLPPNVDTVEKMDAIAQAMKDPAQMDAIVTGWQHFFAAKYEAIKCSMLNAQ